MPTVPTPTLPPAAPRVEQNQRSYLARLSARSAELTASFARTLNGARDAQSRLASIDVSSLRGVSGVGEVPSESPLAQKTKKKQQGPGASEEEPTSGGAEKANGEEKTRTGASSKVDSEGEATGSESSLSDAEVNRRQASGALDVQAAAQQVLEEKPAPETAQALAFTLIQGGDSLKLALVPQSLRTTWATIGSERERGGDLTSGSSEGDRARQGEADAGASGVAVRAQSQSGAPIGSVASSDASDDGRGGANFTSEDRQENQAASKSAERGDAAKTSIGTANAAEDAPQGSAASGRASVEVSQTLNAPFLIPSIARAAQQGRESTGTEAKAAGPVSTAEGTRPSLPHGSSSAAQSEPATERSAFDARLQQAIQSQATRALTAAVNSQTGAVTLRLNPATLGQLKVLVSVEQNAVTAKFEATNSRAKALLEDARETLQDGLKEKGLSVDKIEITLAPRFPERDLGLGAIPRPRDQEPSWQSQGAFGEPRGAQTTGLGAGSADLGGFGGQSATGGSSQSGSRFAEQSEQGLLGGAEDLVPIQLQGLSYRVDASGRLSVDALA